MTIRKLAFAIIQACRFTFYTLPRGGKFHLRVLECGWPEWRTKYLVIGTADIRSKDLYLEVLGDFWPLDESPQKWFFKRLEDGEELHQDIYWQKVRAFLNEEEFENWEARKRHLLQNFDVDLSVELPIAVIKRNGVFIVQDGAHRLALRSLRGRETHTVAISLWPFAIFRAKKDRSRRV